MAQPLHIGSVDIPNIYIGGVEITSAYYGDVPVFSTGGLGITPKDKAFNQIGGTFLLKIRSAEDWTLSMDQTYLTASAYSGTTTDTGVTITVAPNVGSAVTSVITASTQQYSATSVVTIEEGHITLAPNSVKVSPNGETFELTVISPESWQLSVDSNYVTASTYSGLSGSSNVTITTAAIANPPLITVITATSQSFSATTDVEIEEEYEKQYVTMRIRSNGDIVWYNRNMYNLKTLYYSLNGGDWTKLSVPRGNTASIPVTTGDKLRFKGNNDSYGAQYNQYYSFSGSTADFDIYGNLNSLVIGDDFVTASTQPTYNSYAFTGLLTHTNVIDASHLVFPVNSGPAYLMSRYQSMFSECPKLTTAPDLPQTNLLIYDYTAMFANCPNLTFIRCYATNPNSFNVTNVWTQNVNATGTFVKKAGVTSWPTGENGIPSGWTVLEE